MKYIKKYEYINKLPEIGDYVLVDPKIKDLYWLKYIIGKIKYKTEFFSRGTIKYQYEIEFDTKKRNIFNGKPIWVFDSDEIIHYSKDEKELNIILQTIKYNL